MKTAYVFVVVLLLAYGCLSFEKPYAPPSEEALIQSLCTDKVVGNFYDAGPMMKKITSVRIYRQDNQNYYGAGGLSGGLSGVTDIFNSSGQLVMKLHWDDIANNNDPCYDMSGKRVTCPTFVKSVECADTPKVANPPISMDKKPAIPPHSIFGFVSKTIASDSDKIYYSNGTKMQTDNECDSASVKVIMDQTAIGNAIRWLNNSSKDSSGIRVLSWWDYGSSLDCMGLQSIISGKNLGDPQILEIAHLFVSGDESELVSFMKANNIRYLMISSELIGSADSLGEGKYSALNYLSCARDNQTDVNAYPGRSTCEAQYKYSQNKNSAFYKSILYKAVVLNELTGLNKVYSDPAGNVRIFELEKNLL